MAAARKSTKHSCHRIRILGNLLFNVDVNSRRLHLNENLLFMLNPHSPFRNRFRTSSIPDSLVRFIKFDKRYFAYIQPAIRSITGLQNASYNDRKTTSWHPLKQLYDRIHSRGHTLMAHSGTDPSHNRCISLFRECKNLRKIVVTDGQYQPHMAQGDMA